MSSTLYPSPSGGRPTETYPVVQRSGLKFFRNVTRGFVGIFEHIGLRGLFARDILRALGDPGTYVPETLRQMKNIGVDSVPLTVIVAAFIGSVIALQVRYQLFAGVQLSRAKRLVLRAGAARPAGRGRRGRGGAWRSRRPRRRCPGLRACGAGHG